MTKFSKFQDWDPLQACVIGKNYLFEMFDWIDDHKLRDDIQSLAFEIDQNFQWLMGKLFLFDVAIYSARAPMNCAVFNEFISPSVFPRNNFLTIGENLYYQPMVDFDFNEFYSGVKDPAWPSCANIEEFERLPTVIKDECIEIHQLPVHIDRHNKKYGPYYEIIKNIEPFINITQIDATEFNQLSSVSCVGRDRYFETTSNDTNELQKFLNTTFPDTRNHIVATSGSLAKSYVIPCPGLVICFDNNLDLKNLFPEWEIVYVNDLEAPLVNLGQNIKQSIDSNRYSWNNINTTCPIGMLVVDSKNTIIDCENETVINALIRHGVTPSIVPFANNYFCSVYLGTADLYRSGSMQNYFPDRG